MTEETARLDYGREPPGYSVGAGGDFHYKAHNDPPGMWTSLEPDEAGDRWEWGYLTSYGGHVVGRVFGDQEHGEHAAREAAWAWYDRRLALAAGFDALGSDPWPWPECLSWSDKQASTAEFHLGSALPPDGEPTRG